MLQSHTEMTDDNGVVRFDKSISQNGQAASPGENALNFYTQFAQTGSLNYTWNSRLHNSIDAFSEETLGMMFNYSWQIPVIAAKAPKLNFAVAPVPQFDDSNKVNFANYWGYAVAKNKKTASTNQSAAAATPPVSDEQRVGEAWLFLSYLTTKPEGSFAAQSSGSGVGKQIDPNMDPAAIYLRATKEPAARRDLIETQKADPEIGVFATDNLIAKSWRETDPDKIEGIFAEMIGSVNKGQSTVHEALKTAAQRVQNL
jgi:ABC-type glycerol-3-phosphate transport system substrate-binding protein